MIDNRCKAIINSGSRCSRSAVKNGFCTQHIKHPPDYKTNQGTYTAFAPHSGLASANFVSVKAPTFLSKDAAPLLLFDTILVDETFWKVATEDKSDLGVSLSQKILRDLRSEGIIEVRNLIPTKKPFQNAVDDILGEEVPDYPQIVNALFKRRQVDFHEDGPELFEGLLEAHLALQVSSNCEAPLVTADESIASFCDLVLKGNISTNPTNNTILNRNDKITSFKALNEVQAIYSPQIPLLVDKSGKPFESDSYIIGTLHELGLVDMKQGNRQIKLDEDASKRQLERIIKLRESTTGRVFRDHLHKIEVECRGLPADLAYDHYLKRHKVEIAKVQAALIGDATWINSLSKICTYLSIPLGAAGLIDPIAGAAGLGLATAATGLERSKSHLTNKRIEQSRKEPDSNIAWYIYYQDLKQILPKSKVMDRLKSISQGKI